MKELNMRLGEVLYATRKEAGKSQEFMALEMGVSKKTVINWEKGVTGPDFAQSITWFEILNVNPFPWLLSIIYPNAFYDLTGASEDERIDEAFKTLAENMPINMKRSIMYMFYGNHGSSPNAVMQLVLAHLHLPMRDRLAPAVIVSQMYDMEKKLGNLICEENILPNSEILNEAILLAKDSVEQKRNGYTDVRFGEKMF